MTTIQYDGLGVLIDDDAQMVKKIIEDTFPKLVRIAQNECTLHVHVRKVDKGGHQDRQEIRLRFDVPSKKIFESHYEDFDLAKAVHKTCDALLGQVESAFK